MLEVRVQVENDLSQRVMRRLINARLSAIRTTTTWARKEYAGGLATANPLMPPIVFKKFRTGKRVKGGIGNEYGDVFGGGYNVIPKYLAQKKRFRQTAAGAYAGAYYFEGGFVATVGSGHASIFKRGAVLQRSSNYRNKGARKGIANIRHNLPIIQQTAPVQRLGATASGLLPSIRAEFRRRFTAKLNGSALTVEPE